MLSFGPKIFKRIFYANKKLHVSLPVYTWRRADPSHVALILSRPGGEWTLSYVVLILSHPGAVSPLERLNRRAYCFLPSVDPRFCFLCIYVCKGKVGREKGNRDLKKGGKGGRREY